MQYTSTRDHTVTVPSARAIAQGISGDGGLFVPTSLPSLTAADWEALQSMNYVERAAKILAGFLTDFTAEELKSCAAAAYGSGSFPETVAPLVKLGNQAYMLELWHGPTCAFKDMALQLLPHLLTLSAKKEGGGKEIVILVATSGDTGKAALDGFRDVQGTRILVFYPQDGVSRVQKLQMATQEGDNVAVVGVYGNFDDAQTGVKKIFTDPAVAARLAEKNLQFSSANSINWGRLVPQIVYYISAYCDLAAAGEIAQGEKINICVPTGNFGNILAAYYASRMGLPVNRFLCASNENKVLTDFLRTGIYDRRRELKLTSSPSMDILISSNLERLLFDLCGRDDAIVKALMADLSEKGVYTAPAVVQERLRAQFWGGFCDEAGVAATIRRAYEENAYLIDTHTAVALRVYEDYAAETGDNTKTIIASTANPFKFAGSIYAALTGETGEADEFAQIDKLAKLTGQPVPAAIASLRGKEVRFREVVEKEDMLAAVDKLLGL